MKHTLHRYLLGLAFLFGCLWPLTAADQAQPAKQPAQKAGAVDLSEFRTVDTATKISVKRADKVKAQDQASYLGVSVAVNAQGKLTVGAVQPESPAAKAGLQEGDVIVKFDGKPTADPDMFRDLILSHKPNQSVKLMVERKGKANEISAQLAALSSPMADTSPAGTGKGKGGGGGGNQGEGWDTRSGKAVRKASYKLALICIEYPDQKHNATVTNAAWSESLFSKNVYKNKNSVTGQPVYGSMNDYYNELSRGAFRLDGKVFDWVQVSKKRMEYAPLTGAAPKRETLFNEALDKVLARDGKDALKGFDGMFFLFAGTKPNGVPRGNLYWAHRSSVRYDGKSWPYFICPEGGNRMANISVFCHEFGHMLGLPDLYAQPERPGSEGVGQWCAMSNQVGNGRPQHFCAWSLEQLGWITPTVIDPRVKQKLILSPIEGNTKECFKIPLREDGKEYLLLENRKKTGFDVSVPAEGLLIWRVVNGRPILEESHGIEGPRGPQVNLPQVPYPSPANDSMTPYTLPSSRAQLGNGWDVYITNIRRLPDGRISFYVGYEFQ